MSLGVCKWGWFSTAHSRAEWGWAVDLPPAGGLISRCVAVDAVFKAAPVFEYGFSVRDGRRPRAVRQAGSSGHVNRVKALAPVTVLPKNGTTVSTNRRGGPRQSSHYAKAAKAGVAGKRAGTARVVNKTRKP